MVEYLDQINNSCFKKKLLHQQKMYVPTGSGMDELHIHLKRIWLYWTS